MRESKTFLIWAGVAVLVIAFVFQAKSLRSVKNEIAALSAQIANLQGEAPAAVPVVSSAPREAPRSRQVADYGGRIEQIEKAIAQLTRATDYLMERGQLPLAADKLEGLQRRLSDTSLTGRERLQALRLLRRNQGLNDEGLKHAIDLVHSSTNANFRRDVMDALEGVTNAAAKNPLLALASNDSDPEVREEAIESLSNFVQDPQVESKLWELMKSDPNPDIREQAEEALREGTMTPERIARLQQWANDPQASVEDKLLAMRALQRSGTDTSQAAANIAQLAQNTTDPIARARIFDAWDGARDPAMKVPLVNGLQDPNPLVRGPAADALSEYITDSAVEQWLNHIAQTDPDPNVRGEAREALGRQRRR